jgi:hypothetical protein
MRLDKAMPMDSLYRRDLAKMITNFAINILGKEPDTSKTCEFNDLQEQDEEMRGYIRQACQL